MPVFLGFNDVAGNPVNPPNPSFYIDGWGGNRPDIQRVIAYYDDLTKLRVVFTKAVKQVSASNSDDALNPANYTITGPTPVTVTAVTAVQSNIVELSVSGQVVGSEYQLDVQNVEDLANNPVVD